MSGKGDRRRPNDPQKFSEGYDRIFKKRQKQFHEDLKKATEILTRETGPEGKMGGITQFMKSLRPEDS